MMYRVMMASIFALGLAACGEEKVAENQSPTPKVAPKTVQAAPAKQGNPNWETFVVGTEATYQPFEFKDESGQPIGFEIDLLNAIAKNQQFNVQIVSDSRKNAEDALNSGKHRIWVSAFQIGVDIDARYSDSIMSFYRVVAVPENSPIKNFNDLKGKRLAVNQHSSQETLDKAAKVVGETGSVDKQPTFVLAIQSAVAGEKADGVLGDINMLRYYNSQHPEVVFRYIGIDDPTGEIGFAVQKNDEEMQQKLNAGLAAIKADGTYSKILHKWFGASSY